MDVRGENTLNIMVIKQFGLKAVTILNMCVFNGFASLFHSTGCQADTANHILAVLDRQHVKSGIFHVIAVICKYEFTNIFWKHF